MAEQINRIDGTVSIRLVITQIVRQGHLLAMHTQAIDEQVSRDVKEPCTRVIESAKIVAMKERLEKNFLQEIVGVARNRHTVRKKTAQLGLVLAPGLIEAGVGR